ncbi:unnamed protein product [Camellia sinensis]
MKVYQRRETMKEKTNVSDHESICYSGGCTNTEEFDAFEEEEGGKERINDYKGEIEGDGGRRREGEDEEECNSKGKGKEIIKKFLFDLPPLPISKRPRNQRRNRISTLSDRVLLHILSFLPMKDVVRTGALSKRWQNLWTSGSTLVFENQDFEENDIHKFVAFVNHTLLMCRCSNVKQFVLDFWSYEKCFARDVNLWIRFATLNNVEDLHLRLGCSTILEPDGHRLPQHLFTNSSLAILSVLNCVVAPSGDVNWRSLKSLSVEYVLLSDEIIVKILSGCPVLEFLKINSCSGTSRLDINSTSLKRLVIVFVFRNSDESMLEISAPNLQSLKLLGHFRLIKCRLVNVSSLVLAHLGFTFDDTSGQDIIDDYDKQRNQLGELLERLQHVKEIQLGNWCIQVLSIAEVKCLPSPTSSCRILTLHTHIMKFDIPGIARLLQSSPSLETLIVDMSALYHQRRNYWTSQKRIFECRLLRLKTIKITGFWEVCEGFVLPLVQFLLENAKLLEKMVIKTEKSGYKPCSTWVELLDRYVLLEEEHLEGDEPDSGLAGSFNHHLQLSFVDRVAETRAKLAYAPLNQECIFKDSHPFCTLLLYLILV